MPTARELLEQADALMRRKQEAGPPLAADHPPTDAGPHTDSTFTLPATEAASEPAPAAAAMPAAAVEAGGGTRYVSPPEAARGRTPAGALASLPWSAPPPPPGTTTGSPAFAPPPARSPRTIQREPIAPSMLHGALADAPPPVQPSEVHEPDIPLLTDAVEVDHLADFEVDLDVPVLVDTIEGIGKPAALADLGDPSVWSTTFGAAPTISAEPGPLVTPIAAAPAHEVPAPALAEAARDPLGLDRPAPGFVPPASVQWEEAPPADATLGEGRAVQAPPAADAAAMPEEAIVAAAAAPEADVDDAVAAAPAPVPAQLDDARVRAIAEEIGMQVLQRIDIFTDTELRAKLGERLQPVVERVSAELVGAINQHVGELLRSYVAEAIEREIDGWRDRQA